MQVNWELLSPLAFEPFSRELMRVHLQTQIEAFAPGPDGGVDLRAHDGKTVIQCKRYTTDKSKLFQRLKEEAKKERVKNASRYILITSLHLTPNDKDKIQELIPSIQTPEDILGADDLEGLLAAYPDIRTLYPQLWLGDESHLVDVISKEVNRGIDEISKEEFRQVIETMKYIAVPPRSQEALDILKENRAIIITGKPGIGKTTLARYLIWNVIDKSKDYELVFVSSHIDSAFQKFNEEKKQIFFYDDFLGSNFVKLGLEKNEDKRIPTFINKVKNAKNKLAIFTTREFIFQQAKSMYEAFQEHEGSIKKLVLEITDEDLLFKAEIFYNHLWKNKVPYNFVKTLFFDKDGNKWNENCFLARILNNPTYNPRILATATHISTTSTNEEMFARFLLDRVEHPLSLYDTIFRQQLSELQQAVLLVLGTFDGWVDLRQLDIATQNQYTNAYNSPCETFDDALEVLIGDFVTSRILPHADCKVVINFVNPGVRDYIINCYVKNPRLLKETIQSIHFPEQLCYVIDIFKQAEASLLENFHNEISKKGEAIISDALHSDKVENIHIMLGAKIIPHIDVKDYHILKKLLEYESRNNYINLKSRNLQSLISLLALFENDYEINLNKIAFIHTAFETIDDTTVFSIFEDLGSYREFALSNNTTSSASEYWMNRYYQYLSDLSTSDELKDELSIIEELQGLYPEGIGGINLDECESDIESLIDEKEQEEQEESENDDEDWATTPSSTIQSSLTDTSSNVPRYLSIFQTLDIK